MNIESNFGPPPNSSRFQHPSPQILLVEDDELHRHLMGRAFSNHVEHMDVSFAGNLEEARAYLSQGDPDLLIVDFVLPDGRGIELLPRGELEPSYPVVFMTSHGDEQIAVEVMKSGALDYIVKSETTLGDMPHIAQSSMREWEHIQERRRAERALSESESRLRSAVEEAPHPIMVYDDAGQILCVNKMWTHLSGFAEEELRTVSNWTERAVPERHVDITALLCDVHETQLRIEEQKLVIETKDEAQRIWLLSASPLGKTPNGTRLAIAMASDATESELLAEKFEHQSTEDALTGLMNRREFERRVGQALNDAGDHALCYLDLDDFKSINEHCGESGGDEMLKQLARLLREHVRKRDTLARLGGDEFGILLEHCELGQASQVAQKVADAVARYKFSWSTAELSVTASVGLVPVMKPGGSATDIVTAAEIACYAAKGEGRARVHLFDNEDSALSNKHHKMRWVAKLDDALDTDRFQLLWQGIGSLGESTATVESQRGHHYELLLRMLDPNGRSIAPSAFLPAAERYSLSTRIDRWVVSRALRWLGSHPQELESLYLCAINLSQRSITDPQFLPFVINQFSETQVPPESICFEISESTAVNDLRATDRFVRELKLLGCSFALDDFGTTLSSLSYLRDLPVDFVKIDGTFVRDIVKDPIDLALVRSFNDISHVLGKQTIAEAVESDEILQVVTKLGINYAQGFTLGRPTPIP